MGKFAKSRNVVPEQTWKAQHSSHCHYHVSSYCTKQIAKLLRSYPTDAPRRQLRGCRRLPISKVVDPGKNEPEITISTNVTGNAGVAG